MNAPVFYMVLSWMKPETAQPYLDWLDEYHIPEILEQPGFLWVRRIALHEVDDHGWAGTLVIYGMESQAALDAYFASDIRRQFIAESQKFPNIRLQRLCGDVVLTLPSLA